jgi:hypothetical protein
MTHHTGAHGPLYFLGPPWQHTRGSALLGWVKDDAEYLARQISVTPPAQADERARRPLATERKMTDLTAPAGRRRVRVPSGFPAARPTSPARRAVRAVP